MTREERIAEIFAKIAHRIVKKRKEQEKKNHELLQSNQAG